MTAKTQEQTEQTKTDQKPPVAHDWTDDGDINFSITYLNGDGESEGVKFFMKILETETEKELRQKHFAQPDDEQAKTRHRYNAEILSRLAAKAPEGLPDFDSWLVQYNNDLQAALNNYLQRERPKLIRLCNDALNYYRTINQPVEFYAGLK